MRITYTREDNLLISNHSFRVGKRDVIIIINLETERFEFYDKKADEIFLKSEKSRAIKNKELMLMRKAKRTLIKLGLKKEKERRKK